MPRGTRDPKLDSAAARARLNPRKKPYYRLIDSGLHLGYYRGERGGTWIARRYVGTGAYATERLGTADDGREADGRVVLTFTQAQNAARQWATQKDRQDGGIEDEPPWTVARAVEHYLDDYTARGGKARSYVEKSFDAHVLPALGDKRLPELTTTALRAWHRNLATAAARLRTSATAARPRLRASPKDPDAQRARRATANRILTDLKAALNLAYREGKVATDDAWRRVQPFHKVQAARVRYLTDDEATRLINACPPDLRALVSAALLTGCRFGELAALRGADIDLAAGVLTVRASKGGSARTVVLTDEARRFFQHIMTGKAPPGLLFEHDEVVRQATKEASVETRRAPWGRSHQFRPLRAACAVAGIKPAVSFHILRHTHASRLAMRGVPMAVIAAQLGHSDVKLTARHYAHLSPGYVAETIRAAFGSLGVVPETAIVPLRPAARP